MSFGRLYISNFIALIHSFVGSDQIYFSFFKFSHLKESKTFHKRIKKQVAPITRWIVAKPAVQNTLSQALDENAASLEVSDQVVGGGGGSSGLGDVGGCV